MMQDNSFYHKKSLIQITTKHQQKDCEEKENKQTQRCDFTSLRHDSRHISDDF